MAEADKREVTAWLTDSDFAALVDLARRRGTTANTVLRQAIQTEKLIADNVGKDDTLQIKRGNTVSKVVFGSGVSG